jgi:hypothetical protein
MVRNVLVKIGQDQKQFEHAVPLFGIWVSCALLQVFHDGQRIGEQPFKVARVQCFALAGAIQRFIRAQECFVKEMVQAKPFGGQSLGQWIDTPCPAAPSRTGGCHFSPRGLVRRNLRGVCSRDYHNIFAARMDASNHAIPSRNLSRRLMNFDAPGSGGLGLCAVALLVLFPGTAGTRVVAANFRARAYRFGRFRLRRPGLELQLLLLTPAPQLHFVK